MSANLQGMDVAQVRRVARELSEAAGEVTALKTTLSGEVQGLDWEGDDATQFRSSWESEVAQAFDDVNRLLQELSEIADRNASEQESVSAS